MHYPHIPTNTLLANLIGEEATTIHYAGRLRPLFELNAEDAPEACAPILAARELLSRWLAERMTERPEEMLDSPNAVKQYLILAAAGRPYESFTVLYLNAQHRLIAAEELFRGTLTQATVYQREVVRGALRRNAAAVIVSHNHPSGCLEPSRADEHLTASLKSALLLVDVLVLDHIITAGNSSTSLAERGLL